MGIAPLLRSYTTFSPSLLEDHLISRYPLWTTLQAFLSKEDSRCAHRIWITQIVFFISFAQSSVSYWTVYRVFAALSPQFKA